MNGQTHTISAKVSTGSNPAWEIRVSCQYDVSGSGNLGNNNNGSILLGGGSRFAEGGFGLPAESLSLTLPG